MRLSTIILLLIRFKIGNDKKKTLKYVLPTTVCFLLICTGAIIGVEIASAESTRFHGSVRYFKQELSHSQRYILARGPVNLTGSHIEFQEMGDLLVTLLKLS